MSKGIVDYYENYREEDRLSTNNARKIEFLTTTAKLDQLLGGRLSILDCAAGTGAYAFYYAEKGYHITATDITPRHIRIIDEGLKDKPYSMSTMVLDATDMRCFSDESFDVVLNMGPFYHLTKEEQRTRCIAESLRVLKKGGLLVTAYIPRLFLNQMIAFADEKYLDDRFLDQIKETGVLDHEDPKCFWTDTYYSSYEEMVKIYSSLNLEIIDHFAQDGLAPMLYDTVDKWDPEQFRTWFHYHLSVCSEKSIIGMSNHAVIVGTKN